MDYVISAFGLILDPQVLLVIFISSLFGLFVGAVPGLTATMATALLVPITFFMEPVPSISAIVACTAIDPQLVIVEAEVHAINREVFAVDVKSYCGVHFVARFLCRCLYLPL